MTLSPRLDLAKCTPEALFDAMESVARSVEEGEHSYYVKAKAAVCALFTPQEEPERACASCSDTPNETTTQAIEAAERGETEPLDLAASAPPVDWEGLEKAENSCRYAASMMGDPTLTRQRRLAFGEKLIAAYHSIVAEHQRLEGENAKQLSEIRLHEKWQMGYIDEIGALKLERDQANKNVEVVTRHIKQALDERDQLAAKVKELEEAKDVLDWMDSNVCGFTTRDGDGEEVEYQDDEAEWSVRGCVDDIRGGANG